MTSPPAPASPSSPASGKRGRGRIPRIDRDMVVSAALEVGFERLTMTAVATRLGVAHTALYNHVRDRDDLVKTAILAVFAEIGQGDAPHWRPYLEQVVAEIMAVLDRYPGLADRVIQHLDVHPVMAHFSRIAVVLMDRYGFSPAEAIFAVDLLHDVTDVPMLFELQFNEPVVTPDGEVPKRAVGMAPWVSTLDPRLQPEMTRMLASDPQRWFGLKVKAMLDGIERGRDAARDWVDS